MLEVQKIGTHTFYSTPTASQLVALRALTQADGWLASTRARYAEMGRDAAAALGLPAPEGSTFLFLDVGDVLDTRGLDGFLSDCANRGLLLAPGPSFGPYPTHVRLCFTAAPPDVIRRGVAALAALLRERSAAARE
jgi:N-succinyldiaminopimelate aminotransferase